MSQWVLVENHIGKMWFMCKGCNKRMWVSSLVAPSEWIARRYLNKEGCNCPSPTKKKHFHRNGPESRVER